MIPKQIFFIWFGEEKPKYVDFSIDAWKKMNPFFNIELIWEHDFYNVSNKDIRETWDLIHTKDTEYYKLYYREWSKKHLHKTNIGRVICFSDCFRTYLLDKYGGIYIDCDTFPVKPLDNELLNYGGFIPYVQELEHDFSFYDIFFMGSEKGLCKDFYKFHLKNETSSLNVDDLLEKVFLYKDVVISQWNRKSETEEYKIQYNDFYNCKDPKIFDLYSDKYLKHYRAYSWV